METVLDHLKVIHQYCMGIISRAISTHALKWTLPLDINRHFSKTSMVTYYYFLLFNESSNKFLYVK